MCKRLVLILLIVNYFCSTKEEETRFMLDMGSPGVFCPRANYNCNDGTRHYFCAPFPRVNPKCICFQAVNMTEIVIRDFLRSTNGIRNKVAIQYNIANMNFVYWSKELMSTATRFLLECVMGSDPCLIIGEKQVRLTQNRALFHGRMTDRWPGRVVRHWYLELGSNARNWGDVEQKMRTGAFGNFSNMVYPLVEFMGCAGARMDKGHFIVCYYHPPYVRHSPNSEYQIGTACSSCIPSRHSCSRTFTGLCGVDYEINCSAKTLRTLYLLIITLIVCI